jgi:hypothetical protein
MNKASNDRSFRAHRHVSPWRARGDTPRKGMPWLRLPDVENRGEIEAC